MQAAGNWSGTTTSIFLHSSLVDQLYAKEVYFYSFVTKPNQVCIKHSPKICKSFYRAVAHGKSHGIFISIHPNKHSNSICPHFTMEAFPSVDSTVFLHQNLPRSIQKIHKILIGPERPPHTLFFRFKQNFLFGDSPIFPHTGSPPSSPLMSTPSSRRTCNKQQVRKQVQETH